MEREPLVDDVERRSYLGYDDVANDVEVSPLAKLLHEGRAAAATMRVDDCEAGLHRGFGALHCATVSGVHTAAGGRLLVYLDVAYRQDETGFSADRAFLKLIFGLERHFEEVVLVGRVRPGTSDYPVPPAIRVIALPDYPTLRHIPSVLAAAPRALGVLRSAVRSADAVLSIGPHPLSLPTAFFALGARKPLTLMVRQDYPSYIAHRLPSVRWKPFVGVALGADAIFRRLGRKRGVGVVVVGSELAWRYRRSPRLLDLAVSLVPAEAHATHPRHPFPAANGEVRLLAVTRLDPEKAPGLLIEAAALVAERHPDWCISLTIVGDGPMRAELERRATEHPAIATTFAGYVAHGEALFELFRGHDMLVHTAKTEGVPQVVVEALSIGLPTVATDVGGVRALVADGAAALLAGPGDALSLAAAIETTVTDGEGRERRSQRGLRETKSMTLESQAAALAAFIVQARDP
jgi:glycosyltransferase involved in cell wall biosynthesis